MATISKYKSLRDLKIKAAYLQKEVFEVSGICFYFYVFENKIAKEFHAFYTKDDNKNSNNKSLHAGKGG